MKKKTLNKKSINKADILDDICAAIEKIEMKYKIRISFNTEKIINVKD